MSDFGEQVRQFGLKVEAATVEHFAAIAAATHDSIVNGSPVTGAPGQPVDTGALRASWTLAFPDPWQAVITTPLVYAPSIEDGVSYAHGGKPLTLRSQVGGWHSVKQTVLNFDRLAAVTVAGGGNA